MLVAVFLEGGHERLEVRLTTGGTHVLGGEVAVHPGTVPVALEGLAVKDHVDTVLLADAHEKVAGHPDLVGGGATTLAEDLEFPLALGHFGVDALVVDAGGDTDVEVFLDNGAGEVADLLGADAAVIFALGIGVAGIGQPRGRPSWKRKYSCSRPIQRPGSSGMVAR